MRTTITGCPRDVSGGERLMALDEAGVEAANRLSRMAHGVVCIGAVAWCDRTFEIYGQQPVVRRQLIPRLAALDRFRSIWMHYNPSGGIEPLDGVAVLCAM